MALAPGDRLGPYEILSRIGAGGMGEVWKARDPRLDRIVAIKTSSAHFSDRFEREARAIAALNHPHICQLYDVGPDYLVMEYIEGKPLAGRLPLAEALRLGMQIADALAAAHRRGIVHRDLKPANILLTKSGIKVLDFGLARIEPSSVAGGSDETLTQALTQQGAIVGTLQYMAPEQLHGKAADARADIFSFGCVLYEMVTGRSTRCKVTLNLSTFPQPPNFPKRQVSPPPRQSAFRQQPVVPRGLDQPAAALHQRAGDGVEGTE
jgi:serine/threonine protein kinase